MNGDEFIGAEENLDIEEFIGSKEGIIQGGQSWSGDECIRDKQKTDNDEEFIQDDEFKSGGKSIDEEEPLSFLPNGFTQLNTFKFGGLILAVPIFFLIINRK